MAAVQDSLLEAKKSLEKRIRNLESDIRSLELELEEKEDLIVIPNNIPETYEEPPDVKKLQKLNNLSSIVTGIEFDHVTEILVDHTISVKSGSGSCGEVRFDFQLEVEKPSRISNILLTFEDDELDKELKTFKRRLSRERDFQNMMNGIVHYVALILRMNSLLDWMTNLFSTNLQVQVRNSSGSLVTSTKKDEDDNWILSVHWKIKWVPHEKLMTDKFVFDISNKDLFGKKSLDVWSKFSADTHFSEEQIKLFWKEVNYELASFEEKLSKAKKTK